MGHEEEQKRSDDLHHALASSLSVYSDWSHGAETTGKHMTVIYNFHINNIDSILINQNKQK